MNFDKITQESLDGANIRKHNDLIEAKYQLPNLQEQRVVLMLLAQIKPDDEDFKYYRITVADFAEILDLKGNDLYAELDRTTKALVSRTVSIKNGKSFLHMNWLSSAEYKSGFGYVELAFDPKLKPYLLQLKSHFTQYKLDTVLHFKSVYTIRLYEHLKKESFKAKNGGFNVFIQYADLRDNFGVSKKEYLQFNDFRRKTIVPATREITDKTDLYINDVKYGKTGRKITNMTFFVNVRSKDETELRQTDGIKPDNKSENHPIIDELVKLGFSIEIAKKYKNKHGVKKIERNIAYTLAKNQERSISDVPSYLNKAIENDYGNAWEIKQKKELEDKKQQDKLDQAKKTSVEKAKQERNAQNQKAFNDFLQLPENQQKELKKEFYDNTDSTVSAQIRMAEKRGVDIFTSPMVFSNFKIFLVDQ